MCCIISEREINWIEEPVIPNDIHMWRQPACGRNTAVVTPQNAVGLSLCEQARRS